MLNQALFIGDGLTGTGMGATQRFHAPLGAMRLFLGLVDGADFDGFPGLYNDNTGSYLATLDVASTVAEPATGILIMVGSGFMLRRARQPSRGLSRCQTGSLRSGTRV